MNKNRSKYFKKIIVSSLLLTNLAFATTYYVDNSRGANSNRGTSEASAWKTLTKVNRINFEAGDTIKFKKGQTWHGQLLINNEHGEAGAPITFTSYGSGAKPIITTIGKLEGSWQNAGSNIWKLSTSKEVSRLWKDGIEQKCTGMDTAGSKSESELGMQLNDGSRIVWKYKKRESKIWYYSTSNPSNSTFIANLENASVFGNNSSYIVFENLNIQGQAVFFKNANHITIQNNNIGENASSGLIISGAKNLLITNNVFDANYKLKYDGVLSYRGTDARGVYDGITAFSALKNSEIKNNDFINWHHASIALELAAHTNNNIHHNYFTSKDLHYGRAFAISHNGTQHNEIHHNLIENMNMRNQLNGQYNHYHHNWFFNIHDTPYKSGAEGQAFALEPYSGNPIGNIYEYNTIDGTDDPGIELMAISTNGKYAIKNNIFKKNLFKNCGRSPHYNWAKNKGIAIQHYGDVRGNSFIDNTFLGGSTTVYHRQAVVAPNKFNSRNGTGGDTIQGNTSTLTDQGAGTLDRSTVGSGASSSSYVDTPVETTTAPINPFVMTRDGELK